MAFTAKILSWRFRHLNIVGCLLKRRPTKGESRAPQDPPLLRPRTLQAYRDIPIHEFLFVSPTRRHKRLHQRRSFLKASKNKFL